MLFSYYKEKFKHINFNDLTYYCIIGFFITMSFSIFLSNLFFYFAILFLLLDKKNLSFKFHYLYKIIGIFILINIMSLFTSGLGILNIKKIKNLMCFLAFFLAYEYQNKKINLIFLFFIVLLINYLMFILAILTSAFNLTDFKIFEDFVYWPVKYSGLFSISITYGEFLVIILCIAISLLLGGYSYFKNQIYRGFFLALIISNFISLVFTYSRGPWLGMLLSLLVILIFFKYFKTLFSFITLIVIAIILVIINPFNSVILNDLNERISSTFKGYSSGREVIYAVGLKMILDNPILGVGISGVEKNYSKYVKSIEWVPVERKNLIYGHLHNLYLQIYAETGLFGFLIFIWLCFYILFKLFNTLYYMKHQLDNLTYSYVFGVLIMFLSVLLMGISEYNMFNNEISRILWFNVGLAMNYINAHTN